MPNKLTDAEVKMALEEYINFADLEYTNHTSIEVDILKNALDLINRQEGENEKNENIIRVADKTIATLQAENESLKAEVERLNNNISAMSTTLSTSARATRHEAYKEFAERLKEKMVKHNFKYADTLFSANVATVPMVDNLLNELVGDLDGKRKD